MALLDVTDLTTVFRLHSGTVHAVQGVSFELQQGEMLGVVGESGSGKSVTCHSLLRLLPQPPGDIVAGRAILGSMDLLGCSAAEMRRIRGRRIGMVFQDPMTSLNPYLQIGGQVAEPLRVHEKLSGRDARERVVAALKDVGIPDPASRLKAYPHEFSGGMRQRVMIAMALIARPEILIADEPTTALDVTVQAQILELIGALQQVHGMSVILVSHDLTVVSDTCDRVIVMYAGRILETGPAADVFNAPQHPYTRALKAAAPSLGNAMTMLEPIPGQPPKMTAPPAGCPFAPRCIHSRPCCDLQCALAEVTPGRRTACVRVQEGSL